MGAFKKTPNGDYYLFIAHRQNRNGRINLSSRQSKTWWLVKAEARGLKRNKEIRASVFHLKNINIPTELIGKRIRIKLEVLPEPKEPTLKKCLGCGLYFTTYFSINHCGNCLK